MSQLALPFDESPSPPVPTGAAKACDVRGGREDDVQSSEEIEVEVPNSTGSDVACAPTSATARMGEFEHRSASITRAWPAALTWSDALAYSSLSPAQLRRWQKSGALRIRRLGRNGAKVVLRSQLDELLELAFGPASTEIEEDFDFG